MGKIGHAWTEGVTVTTEGRRSGDGRGVGSGEVYRGHVWARMGTHGHVWARMGTRGHGWTRDIGGHVRQG